MLAQMNTMVLSGIEAVPVNVEIDVQTGLPAVEIVGLASTSVKEARERVRSAIKNSGFQFPNRRIVINLSPADLKKEGSHFDLPIALGILAATGQLEIVSNDNRYMVGELSLYGEIKKVPGVLSMALELAATNNKAEFIVPHENAEEASLIEEIESFAVGSLQEAISMLTDGVIFQPIKKKDIPKNRIPNSNLDFSDVRGQETAKRALQVAAAGHHNILLIGPPGSGKTMLARRIPGILPEMTRAEILETTRIYSVAGLLNEEQPLINFRPFRAPHKNASAVSVIGGGKDPRPGEISLAQNGVLFMDELPEFSRDVLESLRQPLEDKTVTISRAQATHTYPCNFSLIGAMNPCPCGFFGSESQECTCTPHQIQKYLNRISGPLLDRMDMHVEVPRVEFAELQDEYSGQSSVQMQESINRAREIQQKRFRGSGINFNAQMRTRQIRKYCQLDDKSGDILKKAFETLNMSARGHDRILKVARSIADLENSDRIELNHITEALRYRSLDRKYWNL